MPQPEETAHAVSLIHVHGAIAAQVASLRVEASLERGDVDDALRMDRIRREVERLAEARPRA